MYPKTPMNLKTAKYPYWANESHTAINMIICWDGIDRELPFTATSNDPEEHGRNLFNMAVSGSFGEITSYKPAPINELE